MQRLFFIESQFLGQTPIPAHMPCEKSIFWYCSACGEVYARMPVDNARWHGIEGCCSKCQPADNIWWQVPGSVWCGWDREMNKQLSREVLKRELELAIKYYEEAENNETVLL